jgi:hypothetical protein
MSAEQQTLDIGSEQLVAKLTETALEVTLKHGVAGRSVDLEIDLWRALERVSKVVNRPLASGNARYRPDWETVLAAYTDSAYRATIRSGVLGSFLELEMGLWHAFRKVLTRILLEAQVSRLRRGTPKTSSPCREVIFAGQQ